MLTFSHLCKAFTMGATDGCHMGVTYLIAALLQIVASS